MQIVSSWATTVREEWAGFERRTKEKPAHLNDVKQAVICFPAL